MTSPFLLPQGGKSPLTKLVVRSLFIGIKDDPCQWCSEDSRVHSLAKRLWGGKRSLPLWSKLIIEAAGGNEWGRVPISARISSISMMGLQCNNILRKTQRSSGLTKYQNPSILIPHSIFPENRMSLHKIKQYYYSDSEDRPKLHSRVVSTSVIVHYSWVKPFNLCALVSSSVKLLYYPPYPLEYEILCNMFRIVPSVYFVLTKH